MIDILRCVCTTYIQLHTFNKLVSKKIHSQSQFTKILIQWNIALKSNKKNTLKILSCIKKYINKNTPDYTNIPRTVVKGLKASKKFFTNIEYWKSYKLPTSIVIPN